MSLVKEEFFGQNKWAGSYQGCGRATQPRPLFVYRKGLFEQSQSRAGELAAGALDYNCPQ